MKIMYKFDASEYQKYPIISSLCSFSYRLW